MSYRVKILRRAKKELARLPETAYERIKPAVSALSTNPRPGGFRKLSGRDGLRIRVGKYRVIYEVDDTAQVVTVLHVGHRKDIYRKLR